MTRHHLAPLLATALAVLLLCASSYIEIPMRPVPITLQTFAVTMIAGFAGWRIGVLATCLWLAIGAAGWPVLAGGSGGIDRFAGPTAGYLFAFPLAALLVGWLSQRGWMTHMRRAFPAMLAGNMLCLLLGAAWLAAQIGIARAVTAGLAPFLIGAAVKALAAAGIMRLASGTAR